MIRNLWLGRQWCVSAVLCMTGGNTEYSDHIVLSVAPWGTLGVRVSLLHGRWWEEQKSEVWRYGPPYRCVWGDIVL